MWHILYMLWYFPDHFHFYDGKSLSLDGFSPVGVMSGSFGVYYSIFGNDLLLVLYRRQDNFLLSVASSIRSSKFMLTKILFVVFKCGEK